jgi:hypothetical protein
MSGECHTKEAFAKASKGKYQPIHVIDPKDPTIHLEAYELSSLSPSRKR